MKRRDFLIGGLTGLIGAPALLLGAKPARPRLSRQQIKQLQGAIFRAYMEAKSIEEAQRRMFLLGAFPEIPLPRRKK